MPNKGAVCFDGYQVDKPCILAAYITLWSRIVVLTLDKQPHPGSAQTAPGEPQEDGVYGEVAEATPGTIVRVEVPQYGR